MINRSKKGLGQGASLPRLNPYAYLLFVFNIFILRGNHTGTIDSCDHTQK